MAGIQGELSHVLVLSRVTCLEVKQIARHEEWVNEHLVEISSHREPLSCLKYEHWNSELHPYRSRETKCFPIYNDDYLSDASL